MKLGKLAPIAAAAAMAFGTPASANSVLFQDVLFTTSVAGSVLTLSIDNALNAGGDWTDIEYLGAFGLKNLGSVTSVTSINPADVNWSVNELNANGCEGGGQGFCFTAIPSPGIALANHMEWDITFAGGVLNGSLPHLKVQFLDANGNKEGSLMSVDVPAIPEPETYAMMLAGLGLLGFVARRRRQQGGLGNAVPA
jgi:hypothetical protein